MDTILISDIKNKSGSIIPYGLNLAKHFSKYYKMTYILNQFKSNITALTVSSTKSFENSKALGRQWVNALRKVFVNLSIKEEIIFGDNFLKSLNNYINHKQPDLIVAFKVRQNIFKKIFTPNYINKLIEDHNIPILYNGRIKIQFD